MIASLLGVLAIVALLFTAKASTTCGDVIGLKIPGKSSVTVFMGIPYAEAPVGELRWQPPVPVEESCSKKTTYAVLPATKCVTQSDDSASLSGLLGGESEDCLQLTVWTTHTFREQKGLPVMVYLHGGGLLSGNAQKQLTHFVETQRVVVVDVNYRLNILGFLATAELSATDRRGAVSGNYGLLDAQLGLRWVQKNIANFGGDPSQVTVYGGSSGGTLVFMLLMSPASEGLFHRAMSNSGSPNITVDLATSERQSAHIVAEVGCNTSDTSASERAACLRSVDAQDMVNAMPKCWDPPIFSWPTRADGLGACGLPVIDGVTLPKAILDTFRDEAPPVMDVPLIVWSNAQEIGTYDNDHRSPYMGLSASAFREVVIQNFDSIRNGSGEAVAAMYKTQIETESLLAYDEIGTDVGMTCGNLEIARAAATHFSSPVYSVVMTANISSPDPKGIINKAFHRLDDKFATMEYTNEEEGGRSVEDDAIAVRIRDIMQTFAEQGIVPGWSNVSDGASQGNSYTVMEVRNSTWVHGVPAFKYRECEFWDQLGVGQSFWWSN